MNRSVLVGTLSGVRGALAGYLSVSRLLDCAFVHYINICQFDNIHIIAYRVSQELVDKSIANL